MKNNIFIAVLLLLLFASCENEIPFDVKNSPPKLIMNALLDSDSTQNYVMLAITGRDQISRVKNASINVYLNGELKEHITESTIKSDSIYMGTNVRYDAYKTEIRFSSGDKIKIEATANDGDYFASAEVEVPEPVAIEKIDTTTIREYAAWNNSSNRYLRVKATFTDDKQKDNYYRITINSDIEAEVLYPYINETEVVKSRIYHYLHINEDIVLTDGRPTLDNDNAEIMLPIENMYTVFDDSRIDGTYTMTVKTYYPEYGYGYYPGSHIEIKKMKAKMTVRLLSLSKMYYFYLRALNIYDSSDYDDYLSLPIKFPSNVKGGTGIVGVSTASKVVIDLNEYELYPNYWGISKRVSSRLASN